MLKKRVQNFSIYSKISVFIIIFLSLSSVSHATCSSTFFNPVTDICWQCIFPFKIGGIPMTDSSLDSPTEKIKSPVCLCGSNIGLTASFWEPARMVETVKDAYCFNTLGLQMTNPSSGFLDGMSESSKSQKTTFAQAHWYLFPVWSILNLFLDTNCLDTGGFDLAYMTEIDPTWNSDLLGFILNPEALLFANPITQMACMADSIASTVGVPLSPLFWCMGSWGSAYPLTGNMGSDSFIQANAGLAARMIYKMARELLLWDTGLNECGAVMMPVWVKENYRMHIMKPRRDSTCHPIGRSGLIWSSMKNPPGGAGGNSSDNFNWMIFKKRLCCVGYSF